MWILTNDNTGAIIVGPTEEELEDVVQEIREVPRLAVIREEPDDEASRDGITARAKVPSWDEIMFGIKPEDK